MILELIVIYFLVGLDKKHKKNEQLVVSGVEKTELTGTHFRSNYSTAMPALQWT